MTFTSANKKIIKRIGILILCIILFLSIIVVNRYYNKNEIPAANLSQYLYHVTKDDKSLYLLGAYHSGAKPPILDEAVRKAYEQSDVVVFETDMDQFNEQFNLDTYKLNPISKIDSSALGEQFEKINKKYKGIKESDRQYSAFFIQNKAINEVWSSLDLRADYGGDTYLYRMAQKDKKKIGALETVNERESMTTRVDQSCSNYLLYALDNKQIIKENILGSARQYADGSYAASSQKNNPYEAMRDTIVGQEEEIFQEIMLRERSDLMYERSLAFMEEQVPLVVVGIDHLFFDRGLLEQFEQNGYQVQGASWI